MDHWTEEHIAACNVCPTLRELSLIAIDMLKTLSVRAKGQHVNQICGPMTTGGLGSIELNMPVFRQAVNIAHERGLVVFDQLPFQDAMIRITDYFNLDHYPDEIITEFYYPVFESRLITCAPFLPTWATSRGARMERERIEKVGGIEIVDYPVDWYEEAVRQAATR
jgi:hypothetical protein